MLLKPFWLPKVFPLPYTEPMAKVLFFLQLIVAVVVLPLWPGLDPRYATWGLVYLAFVLVVPALAVLAVHGPRTAGKALSDAWSPVALGPGSEASAAAWGLAMRTLPVGALLGGLVALIGALDAWDPQRPAAVQTLVLVFFCFVWGFLGFLLARIFHQIVVRLSQARGRPLLEITPEFSARFGLTPRETEAVQAILDGATYKDAAEALFISPSTVKSHVLSVYQKTGTGNKIELLRLVEAQGWRIHPSVDGPPTPQGRS